MKNIFFITILFISLVSFGQNKFIEVEVTDTISLQPLRFQCNLYLDTYSYDDVVVEVEPVSIDGAADATPAEAVVAEDNYDAYDPLAAEEKAKNKLQMFKMLLESNKFRVEPLNESKTKFSERRGSTTYGYTIIVSSDQELQRLRNLVANRVDVTASVVVLEYADELKAEEQLIKKLINKAKVRATAIGANSGLKVGKILEVKEGKRSSEISVSELYTQILKMGNYGQENNDLGGSITKTFVVKFAAE